MNPWAKGWLYKDRRTGAHDLSWSASSGAGAIRTSAAFTFWAIMIWCCRAVLTLARLRFSTSDAHLHRNTLSGWSEGRAVVFLQNKSAARSEGKSVKNPFICVTCDNARSATFGVDKANDSAGRASRSGRTGRTGRSGLPLGPRRSCRSGAGCG